VEFKKILFPIRPIPGAAEKYDFLRKIIGHTDAAIKILVLATTYNDPEKKLLHKFVRELKVKLTQDEVEISGNVKAGKYVPGAVLKMSRSIDADMIAITVNNDPGFKQFFLGPFEQQIINHATVPVLSVRPKLVSPDSQVVIQQIHESFPEQVPLFA
jgi:nucleotide-binding universal stress UspA family protein